MNRCYVLYRNGEYWAKQVRGRPRRVSDEAGLWGLLERKPSMLCTMGDADHARLIVRASRRGIRVALVRPDPAWTNPATPASETLARMRECTRPPMCGGWHTATEADFATYALLAGDEPDDGNGEPAHPLLDYLGFVVGLDEAACRDLIREVVDPRWHADPERPERFSRLQMFLGVNPRWFERLRAGGELPPAARRLQMVSRAWAAGDGYPLDMPGNFIQRIYVAGGRSDRAFLRASRRFVLFLGHAWRQVIYEANGGAANQLFVPELFFKQPAEIEGFKQHLSRCREARRCAAGRKTEQAGGELRRPEGEEHGGS